MGVFVLIGIILLVIVGGYLSYKYLIVEQASQQRTALLSRVPQELQPVALYLDSCVQQVTLDALTTIGSQGGLAELAVDPIPLSPFVPIPKNLEVVPNTDLKVPLWFREAGNGIDETNVPSQDDVEKAIVSVITKNFKTCMDNLSAFSEQGFEMESTGEVSATVNLEPRKVISRVNVPLTVSYSGVSFDFEEFIGEVDSSFGDLYLAAREIFDAENQGLFLENKTIDMLVAYDPEVPFSGNDLSCSQSFWSKTEVTNRLKAVLFENVAIMKVKDTNFDITAESQKYLVFDALKKGRSDTTVNFMYSPDWPTLVEISPSEGDILKSDPVANRAGGFVGALLSSYFCLNNHHFVYTIKYPVLIALTSEDGASFQFATEVIIDRNLPRENKLPLPVIPEVDSPLCQYPSSPLTVNTFGIGADGSLNPMNRVDLSLKCYPVSCPLVTKTARQSTVLLAPPCVNAIIEANKEGYFTGKAIVSTNTKAQQEVDVLLEKIYPKQVEIKMIDKNTGEIREPYSSEMISFEFKNKDARFTKTFTWQSEGDSCEKEADCGPNLECKSSTCQYIFCKSESECGPDASCDVGKCVPKKRIELIPGEYEITAYAFRSSTHPITTEKKVVEKCVDTAGSGVLGVFFTEEKCFSSEIPSLEVKQALVGGEMFDLVLERGRLASTDTMVLYVLVGNIPADAEGMADVQTTLSTNKDHSLFRYPEL